MGNKFIDNNTKNRAKSFALGLLCVLVIGIYFVSTVNISAAEEAEQEERPEGMSEKEWEEKKKAERAAREDIGSVQEPINIEGLVRKRISDFYNISDPHMIKPTQPTGKIQSGGKIEQKTKVTNLEITPEQRAYFERHMAEIDQAVGAGTLAGIIAGSQSFSTPLKNLEKEQQDLAIKTLPILQKLHYKREFNALLDDILLMQDESKNGSRDTEITEKLQNQVNQLTVALNEQAIMLRLSSLERAVKENEETLANASIDQPGLSRYERARENLGAPKRFVENAYFDIKSKASDAQERLKKWLGRNSPEEMRARQSSSTAVQLSDAVKKQLIEEATEQEERKYKDLSAMESLERSFVAHSTSKLVALGKENEEIDSQIKTKIAILKRVFTPTLNELLGKLQGMYNTLTENIAKKQELEAKLAEQAKQIATSSDYGLTAF